LNHDISRQARVLLSEFNVEIDKTDSEGQTALHIAATLESEPLFNLLMQHGTEQCNDWLLFLFLLYLESLSGADPNILDNDGNTPIKCASPKFLM